MAASAIDILYPVSSGRRRWWPLAGHREGSGPGTVSYEALTAYRPDLVILSNGNHFAGLAPAMVCIAAGIPYINILQLVTEFHFKGDEETERLRRYYDDALLNVFVSEQNARLAEQLLGGRVPNVRIARNPPSRGMPLLPYPPTAGGFRLACPARLHALHKGQDILLRVFDQAKWRERPVSVDCYGDGPYGRMLERLRAAWNIRNVAFRGTALDMDAVWADHHALVLPSRMEGKSLALVEAMACGRTAVVTDVGGARELLTDNVTGFIAAAPTPELFDEALERAWAARSHWEAMGKLAHARSEAYLSPDPVEELCEWIRGTVHGA